MIEGFRIHDRQVGLDHEPYVIAEMSGNHNQSLDRALEILEAAHAAGAHACKLQTYRGDTITLDHDGPDFRIQGGLWAGRRLFELYEEAHTPWEWHEAIFRRGQELGIAVFSSPFDETAVDFLESLGAPAYKIASPELVHLPLLKKVAATGKPMILSTGMATVAEIDEAVRTVRAHGCRDMVLLKCTSTYPASPLDCNLRTLGHLHEMFGCHVGLSDHTMGVGVAVAAVALGATVVEKHFTLRRADGGVDSAFSMEPEEMKSLVTETARAWQALGTVRYGPTAAEVDSLPFRRSIYVATDLKAGDVLTTENLRVVRPGFGLAPSHYEELVGRRVTCDVPLGTPMSWDLVGGA
ncbi:MAG: pseudaminic acid synthase [Gemmatimonadetes bacterium]|nr:pseudaminic acid synthase [Gemmatimonadota bacterium]